LAAIGVDPQRGFIGPTASELGCMSIKEGEWAGLMKPRRGLTLVAGKEKLGVDKKDLPIDKNR